MSPQRTPSIEDVLNDCLERMARGATVDDCLAAYPDWVEQLGPLLRTASALRGSLRLDPDDAARAAGRQRLRQAMERPPARRGWRLPVLRGPLGAWAAAAMLTIVFAGGFGVVQASSDSLPNDVLYPVKRTVERARLAWPFRSAEGKARLSEELARRRADEIARVATKNQPKRLAALAERLAENVQRSVRLSLREADRGQARVAERLQRTTGQASEAEMERIRQLHQKVQQRLTETRTRLQRDYQANRERLQFVLAHAPADRQALVRSAIQQVDGHYQDALRRIDVRLSILEEGQPPGLRRRSPEAVPGAPRPGVERDGSPGTDRPSIRRGREAIEAPPSARPTQA
ncbi:MAG: DUF5667 domain-containing protein [Dehalococcoidia bacterium]